MSCQITVAELDSNLADKEGQRAVEADNKHVTELVPGPAVLDHGKFTFVPCNYIHPKQFIEDYDIRYFLIFCNTNKCSFILTVLAYDLLDEAQQDSDDGSDYNSEDNEEDAIYNHISNC